MSRPPAHLAPLARRSGAGSGAPDRARGAGRAAPADRAEPRAMAAAPDPAALTGLEAAAADRLAAIGLALAQAGCRRAERGLALWERLAASRSPADAAMTGLRAWLEAATLWAEDAHALIALGSGGAGGGDPRDGGGTGGRPGVRPGAGRP